MTKEEEIEAFRLRMLTVGHEGTGYLTDLFAGGIELGQASYDAAASVITLYLVDRERPARIHIADNGKLREV